jgi:signal transduction histidine kinase
MGNGKPLAWFAWAAVVLLAGSCCVLAILQYGWITEFSSAERQRLHDQLQNSLNLLSRQFNDEIGAASGALIPSDAQVSELRVERAYETHYESWRQSTARGSLFRRIALAIPTGNGIELRMLNPETGRFSTSAWPAEWAALQQRIASHLDRSGGPPPVELFDPQNAALLEIPRFGSPGGPHGPSEREWLIEELNVGYIRDAMLPELMNRFLGSGKRDYDAEVVLGSDPSVAIFGSKIEAAPDGSVALLDIHMPRMRGPGPPRGTPPGPSPRFGKAPPPPRPRPMDQPPAPPNVGNGRWRLLVRHHDGSLEALVDRARWRNLAASAGLLLLILLTVALLVRFSRQSQRLAQQQMNFVASVSHELRTPLTVIRTAAFNLGGRLASRPEQVERYGSLIQEESEKLTALVEQVLTFASGEAGHVIRDREPVEVSSLIDSSLQSSGAEEKAVVERNFQPDLPPVLADKLAMKHALQNLVENALKYGKEGRWVGVSACSAETGSAVEIRVADHGPGIFADEQDRIFDPFFRGRRALSDQVHGTGLGLSLVKKIVEAHGGSIRVDSGAAKGTEFIVRIPAAPAEQIT